MPTLEDLITSEIIANGPMRLDTYMERALLHPEFGYYQKQIPFGSKGDFVTSPEISQMFGELIGLWCVDTWAKLGAPSKFAFVEMGPGRGILMQDALRSAKLVPEFLEAAEIHLVEASDQLIKVQQERLKDHPIQWHSAFPDIPDGMPVICIGNEFLDALPIRQFQLVDGGWQEKKVTVTDDGLTFVTPPSDEADLADQLPSISECSDGDIAEISTPAREFISFLAKKIKSNRGAALFIDYGPAENALGDSFQAVQRHEYSNPLENPGGKDLTAHVHFSPLREVALSAGCAAPAIEGQGRFLERLGIEARVMQLSKNATEKQHKDIVAAHKRLVSEQEMGTLFKAFSFSSGLAAPAAGFGDAE
ncbi:class I SAM-dependent methyltransferase [Sneathiella sp. P13V-1]|uniref:class I SAM-dependent methyltransferase n=1 Tax=Sneathiella sp. P13V-1 TaxID=2697366 RepID=UPI00187B5865|nr:SAM-dependent methyltransferase [Sneathiella sp. P13V-1]MBE7638076.1 class I SAM-dependent methyltransferase [Sneathiella sp. P13V-1]